MGLLTKLKSLLGLEDDRSQVRRGESGVTIEREPSETAEPDAEVESAVKGVDTGAEGPVDETERDELATEAETGESAEAAAGEAAETGTDESVEAEADEPAEVETEEPAEIETDRTEGEDTAEAGVSTEDVTTTPEEEPEEAVGEAAEPSEAVEPTPDAAEPDQSAADEPEPTPEDTEDEAAAEEPVGDGEPLENVKGIGSAYAERLRDAGVSNVAELATADADRLADETDLSVKRISGWIDRAKSR